MADMAKDQRRAELHRAIWGIADEVRGSIDVIFAELEADDE